jgi:hypothetical protein
MPERNTDGRSVGRIELRQVGPAEDADDALWMSEA